MNSVSVMGHQISDIENMNGDDQRITKDETIKLLFEGVDARSGNQYRLILSEYHELTDDVVIHLKYNNNEFNIYYENLPKIDNFRRSASETINEMNMYRERNGLSFVVYIVDLDLMSVPSNLRDLIAEKVFEAAELASLWELERNMEGGSVLPTCSLSFKPKGWPSKYHREAIIDLRTK